MGANIDDAKGKVKEAAGDLTDNEELETEGKADQIGAKVKEFGDKAKDRIHDAVDSVKEHLHN